MKQLLAICAFMASLALMSGAYAQPLNTRVSTQPVQQITNGPVAPVSTQTSAAPSSGAIEAYRLGAGDIIRITVHNEPDLSVEQTTVGPAGDIAAPLIGSVTARNLTTSELSAAIAQRYEQGYLRSPRVAVSVVTFRPFYVVGEVARPGAYPYAADLTTASAIAFAGGFARGASRGRVYIRRAGETAEHPFASSDNIAVHPGDTVRVGESALSIIRQLPLGFLN